MAKESTLPSDSTSVSATIDRITAADRDRIAQRAYELYLERGAADGRDFDDWLLAEREISSSSRREPIDDGD
jgi:outer membrane protein TolC